MILLYGLSGDGPLDEVTQSLERRNAPFLLLDQRRVLDTHAELSFDSDESGFVVIDGRRLDLGTVTAVYLRNYDWRRLPEMARAGVESAEWSHAGAIEEIMNTWLDLTDALVVNLPSAMKSNASKPYQAAVIRDHGFDVPETLITTDPAAVLDFRDRYGPLIYKSISSVRSVVSRLADEQLERIDDIAWCPTQFQRCIPGRDYRLHVVGDMMFASEIVCEADDYRYPGGNDLQIRPCDVPLDIADRARALAVALDLPFAGVDLRRTPEDEWYCFEVNPSPGFTFYESQTGQPIADAVARILADTLPSTRQHELNRRPWS